MLGLEGLIPDAVYVRYTSNGFGVSDLRLIASYLAPVYGLVAIASLWYSPSKVLGL